MLVLVGLCWKVGVEIERENERERERKKERKKERKQKEAESLRQWVERKELQWPTHFGVWQETFSRESHSLFFTLVTLTPRPSSLQNQKKFRIVDFCVQHNLAQQERIQTPHPNSDPGSDPDPTLDFTLTLTTLTQRLIQP